MKAKTEIQNPYDVIVGLERRASAFNEIAMAANELARILKELGTLFKRTQLSKTVTMRKVGQEVLLIGATTAVYVAHPILLKSNNTSDFEISFIYKDISDLLPSDGIVTCLITHEFVEFSNGASKYNFSVVDANVPEVPGFDEDKVEKFETAKLKESFKVFAKLLPVAAVYKKSAAYLMAGDYAQMRFPSVWIETESSVLTLELDSAMAVVISEMLFDTKRVGIVKAKGWTMLKKDLSELYLPMNYRTDIQRLEDVAETYDYIGDVELHGVLEKVTSLTRTIGKVDCAVSVFENGAILAVETPEARLEYATMHASGQVLDTFKVRIEFLNVMLSILGSKLSIYRKGPYRMLTSSKAKIIFTSI